MAVVAVDDAEIQSEFVQRERFGKEVRDSFLHRPDLLSMRVWSEENSDVFDSFARGRPDHLKAYHVVTDGFSQRHEAHFYKRTNCPVKYVREVISKGGKLVRYRLEYAPEPGEDWVLTRTVTLLKDASFDASVEPISLLRNRTAVIAETYQVSSDQPSVRFEHDLSSDVCKLWLWPPLVYDRSFSGDAEADEQFLGVHTFRQHGQNVSVEKDKSQPTAENLAEEYEWMLKREQQILREVLLHERWMFVFNQGFNHAKDGPPSKPPAELRQNLEASIQRLFDEVDKLDVQATAGNLKSSVYDSASALLEQRIAELHQQLRDKDRLIEELAKSIGPK
eukprot:TRINITY_DN12528_c0_g1_i1.p2 TRINITY_DN12528_c0_g1~~TRINITY_DN12528_c0_g1_i1.p2  ORF type:complete len:335 (+),score=67.55 TRINITY_DN12528_c0_g1_i1:49-1053(+)